MPFGELKTMQADRDNQSNTEITERIESVKNISYIAYSGSQITTMVCAAVFAVFLISAPYIMIATSKRGWQSSDTMSTEYITVWAPIILAVAVAIIVSVLVYIFANKQYLVECENGETVLAIGSFRRFRKYYVGKFGYEVKNGAAYKISAKKGDTVKTLFSAIKKCKIQKTVSGNKEVFSIVRKNYGFFTNRTMPFKHGTIKFIDGKFKKGSYVSSSRRNALHIKVIKNDVNATDVIPSVILDML